MLPVGRYAIKAAIAALHAEPNSAGDTDWPQIAALYGLLAHLQPSPVVELNRAVAVAMAEGPPRGLALMAPLAADLDGYHWYRSARADLLRRLGRWSEAAGAYRRALEHATNAAERSFLQGRLAKVRRERGGERGSKAPAS